MDKPIDFSDLQRTIEKLEENYLKGENVMGECFYLTNGKAAVFLGSRGFVPLDLQNANENDMENELKELQIDIEKIKGNIKALISMTPKSLNQFKKVNEELNDLLESFLDKNYEEKLRQLISNNKENGWGFKSGTQITIEKEKK